MDIVKPAPLVVNGKALYSLSSYDPVEVEVIVPFTTEDEVDLAVAHMVGEEGGTQANLRDPNWIAKHFEGIRSADELRRVVRARVREMNEGFAEEQKRDKCMIALADRLEQRVLDETLAMVRAGIENNFKQRAAVNRMTLDDFIAQGGVSRADFDAMLDSQALQTAQIDAALDAYAREKKLFIADQEVAGYLGMNPSDAKELIRQAKAAGRYDDVKAAALHAKAGDAVVAECSCTYHHESEQEAAERLAMLRDLMGQS